MEDKRTALAIFLSLFVILVYYELAIGPQDDALRKERLRQAQTEKLTPAAEQPNKADIPTMPGIEQTTPSSAPETVVEPAQKALSTVAIREAQVNSEQIVIESNVLTAVVSSLGGRILSLKLKDYKASLDGKSNKLIDMVAPNIPVFPLGVYSGGINDALVKYSLAGATAGTKGQANRFMVPENSTLSLSLSGKMPNGSAITKTLHFSEGKYLFNVEVDLEKAAADGSNIWLEWIALLPDDDKESSYNPKKFLYLDQDNSIEAVQPKELSLAFKQYTSKWTAFGDNYFMTALLPTTDDVNTVLGKSSVALFFRVSGSKETGKFQVYSGPKQLQILTSSGFLLERSIELGMFALIGQPILLGIEYLYVLLGNYGLAIILLTLLLKTLLLPLTKKSLDSMKKMQELQPEIAALRERFKDDPTQLNQETFALYRKRGVNPLGGCFPILIQIPIFLGMYNALRTSFDLRHQPFALWINDLSAPEKLDVFGIPVPVMILIMGASMFIQQWTTPSTASPEQRKIMLLTPIIFTGMFLAFPFPSGLVLYWLVNNLISIVQQVALRSERNISSLQATVVGGVLIFGGAFLLTLI